MKRKGSPRHRWFLLAHLTAFGLVTGYLVMSLLRTAYAPDNQHQWITMETLKSVFGISLMLYVVWIFVLLAHIQQFYRHHLKRS
jgi:hypothetical protein